MRRSVLGRVASLALVLRRDPREFADRVGAILAGRVEPWRVRTPVYEPLPWEQLVAMLPAGAEAALEEHALAGIERRIREATAAAGGIDARHDGDVLLGRCCYALVRVLRPTTVVETGVAHGVTSACILAALDRNGAGTLHSIDLPPHDHGAEEEVGTLVPPELRGRWQLHRGLARRVLPRLLEELGAIDFFVHDSLHTYANMRMELGQAWTRLTAKGAVIADDVQGNPAFLELRARARLWAVCAQATKPALFGVALR